MSLFLSTLSLRRATTETIIITRPINDISIHALLAESDWQRGSRITYVEISIHALLAESDAITDLTLLPFDISIHALLAESDGVAGQELYYVKSISIHALLADSDLASGM